MAVRQSPEIFKLFNRCSPPTYLEPWYGIGTVASAFGAQYEWMPGQAPAVKTLYKTFEEAPDLIVRKYEDVPIMKYTLETIE